MKIYNMPQGSQEWFDVRIGKLTGSNFHHFFSKSKNKNTLLFKKASERLTKKRCDSDFKNIHTDRGKYFEEIAISLYELEYSNPVKSVGFIELDNYVGCSPDGLVGEDGIIEVKCKDNHKFIEQIYLKDDAIEPEYITQMQFNMYVSGRKWCDYICFNGNYENSIYVKRIYIDDEYIKKIKKIIKECNLKISEIITFYNNIKENKNETN